MTDKEIIEAIATIVGVSVAVVRRARKDSGVDLQSIQLGHVAAHCANADPKLRGKKLALYALTGQK